MYEKNKYQIIYLNGPSSVGKSTLARSLQNNIKEPFLVIGIDQIIYMMPEKMNDWHHINDAPGFSWQPVKDELLPIKFIRALLANGWFKHLRML